MEAESMVYWVFYQYKQGRLVQGGALVFENLVCSLIVKDSDAGEIWV